MPSEVWLPSEDATSLPSGPNRSIRRSCVGSGVTGDQSIWKRMRTSYLESTWDGTLTVTWCSSRNCAPPELVGSHAPVRSSISRLAWPLLNGARPLKVTLSEPGELGSVTVGVVAAKTDVPTIPQPTMPAAASKTPVRRNRTREHPLHEKRAGLLVSAHPSWALRRPRVNPSPSGAKISSPSLT